MSKISIIMGVFNSEETLKSSIESILGQSFRDFEFLILDDCSTDNSFEIADIYRKKDKRIKLYRNHENLGLTKSLNILIENSKSDYIARQDSDDVSRNKRLEAQLSFIKNFKLDGCTTKAISQQTGKILHKIANKFPPKVTIKYKNPFIHGTLLIKKDVIQEIGNYDERFYYSQDYKLMKDLLEKRYRYKVLSEALYFLNTENNISNIFKKEQEYYANCVKSSISPDHEYLEKI